MPFTFKRLEIPDVVLVEPKSFSDDRGFFLEGYKKSEFAENGIDVNFIQDNFSHSKKNVLRGLHYQKDPKAQAKLVIPLSGSIFDVAVDIRVGSPTFGKWISQILSADKHTSLFVPRGFAHGFCIISNEADVLYKVDQEYSAQDERGIVWNDSSLAIDWPTDNPILAKRDLEFPKLDEIDNNFSYK